MKERKYEYFAILITYIVLFIGIIVYLTFANKFIKIPDCPIYSHFGLYCPACGGTRAVISLFHLKLIKSFLYHPIVLYTFIVTTCYLIIETINNIRKTNIKIEWKKFIKIGIIILLLNWIIQNIIIIFSK